MRELCRKGTRKGRREGALSHMVLVDPATQGAKDTETKREKALYKYMHTLGFAIHVYH